ncbi:unnamed protein product [Dicrocoelium dendriticum]|nr:unnamed protein product [Dicrocoelium dendriticum]
MYSWLPIHSGPNQDHPLPLLDPSSRLAETNGVVSSPLYTHALANKHPDFTHLITHQLVQQMLVRTQFVSSAAWAIPSPQQLYEMLHGGATPDDRPQCSDRYSRPTNVRNQPPQISPTIHDLSLNRTSDKLEAPSELNQSDPGTFGTLPSPSTNSSPTEPPPGNNTACQTPTEVRRRQPIGDDRRFQLHKPCSNPQDFPPISNSLANGEALPSSSTCRLETVLPTNQSAHPSAQTFAQLSQQSPNGRNCHSKRMVANELSPASSDPTHWQSLHRFYMYFMQTQYRAQYQAWLHMLSNDTTSLGMHQESPGKHNVSPPDVAWLHSTTSIKPATRESPTRSTHHGKVKGKFSGELTEMIQSFDVSKAADSDTYTSISTPQSSDVKPEPAVGRIYSCKLCSKVYSQASALKMHVRTHTLPCRCIQCGKSFSRKWLLKGHERTHTGERPYACSVCSRSFADRSNLRAHMQTHQREKRYGCPHCPRSFSRMGLLSKHLAQCASRDSDVGHSKIIPGSVRSQTMENCSPLWLPLNRLSVHHLLNVRRC